MRAYALVQRERGSDTPGAAPERPQGLCRRGELGSSDRCLQRRNCVCRLGVFEDDGDGTACLPLLKIYLYRNLDRPQIRAGCGRLSNSAVGSGSSPTPLLRSTAASSSRTTRPELHGWEGRRRMEQVDASIEFIRGRRAAPTAKRAISSSPGRSGRRRRVPVCASECRP